MLSVAPKYRDYLRFYFPCNEKQLVHKHCQVVFGVSSSPYLLNASIMNLLENYSPEYKEVAQKLKSSFYVDNCVAGVFSVDEIEILIEKAKLIMSKGCFNLRTLRAMWQVEVLINTQAKLLFWVSFGTWIMMF
ncbi:integrase_H2C2 domain-containing protein [Trichonephila clavata]|uniref:Integrase_H2C2 domain-containing protein n=1 Tax=Trichonephila clavata TaxID=2740835 RepID=A0A8X6J1X1_TRICU|nr:integrase_H2C2 domain-containing protein [Trichonephila clavata]